MSPPAPPAPFDAAGTCSICGIPAVTGSDYICSYCLRAAVAAMLNTNLTPAQYLGQVCASSLSARVYLASVTGAPPLQPFGLQQPATLFPST